MKNVSGDKDQLEGLLSSDWAFGLTRKGGVFRGRLLTLLVLIGWVFVVLVDHSPGSDVFAALNYLLDPSHNYFDLTIFIVLTVLLLSIQVLLLIYVIMRKRPLRRITYWTPLILAILLALLTGLVLWMGQLLGGTSGLVIAFIIVLIMNGLMYWFSDKIVLWMYKAEPVTEAQAPELYAMVRVLVQNMRTRKPPLGYAAGGNGRVGGRLRAGQGGARRGRAAYSGQFQPPLARICELCFPTA